MKKRVHIFLVSILIVLLAACGENVASVERAAGEDRTLTIERFNQQTGEYEAFKKLTSTQELNQFDELLGRTSWEEVELMATVMAPFQLFISHENMESKAVLYTLYVNGENVELYMENENIATLAEADETWLYEQVKEGVEVISAPTQSGRLSINEDLERIVTQVEWQDAKVKMERVEDFTFELASGTLRLWFTQTNEIELVMNNQYAKVDGQLAEQFNHLINGYE